MPLFKGQGCKSTPNKAIAYITDTKKAAIVSSYALDGERSYAEQFKETAKLYDKGKNFDERKYYHFKLSCDQADNVTPELSHELAESMVKKFFSSYECVIATHTDTNTVHSHIIVNAVNFETGNKLHCNNKEYAEMKDAVNVFGLKKGLSVLNWRQPSQDRITTAEKRIQLKGGTSWKEELKEVITEAIQQSKDFNEFVSHLKKYDVTLERNTEKTISFKHPNKEKPIRGDKLGQIFTKGAILNAIDEQRNRAAGTEQNLVGVGSASPDERKSEKRAGKQSAERVVDGVQREIRGITEGVKEYSPSGREELRERAEQERREAERIARERESAKERQRAAELEHQERDNGFDIGR